MRTLSACRSSRDGQIQFAQLGDAVDAARHFVAEILADLFERGGGVFHHVVQQTGFKASHVHLHLGKLARDHQRMDHVGLAGGALLALMPFGGEAEGLLERRQIFGRTQLMQTRFQLIEKRFDWVDLT